MTESRSPKTDQNYLIINIFGIGDVLFTTPLIRNIKAQDPQAFIGYVANRRTAPLIEDNPSVDKVIVYERDELCAVYKRSKTEFFQHMKKILQSIKKDNYDVVIDLSLNRYASFLMWLVGIPQRIGFNYKNRSPFLTKKIPFESYAGSHVVEYYLRLLEELGMKTQTKTLDAPLNEKDRQWAEIFLKNNQLAGKNFIICIVPGGGASWGKDADIKRWPASHYAKLADKIIEKFSVPIILFGDRAEQSLCENIAGLIKYKVVLAAGQTSIGQGMALLARCSLAVVNDGGPLHMAAAAGIRTISLFGPVDERVYGPYPPDGHSIVTHDIACRPCYRQFRRAACEHISCVKQIKVEDVFIIVEKILRNNQSCISI